MKLIAAATTATSDTAIRTMPNASMPVRLYAYVEAPSAPDDGPGPAGLYPDQVGLALFSLLAIGGGIYAVARFLL